MKKMILDLLAAHEANCGDACGKDGEYLKDQIDNIRDLVKNFPSDDEIARMRKDSIDLSWVQNPERMGQ